MWMWIGIAVWVICYVLCVGFAYAHARAFLPGASSPRKDAAFAMLWSLGGPLSLFVILMFSGFGEDGWQMPFTERRR